MTAHGFSAAAPARLDAPEGTLTIHTHDATGARLAMVRTDDENKVFGVAFATPPEDSTGVAHILEHSVLCGSAKYPVKEPFVELLKGSLQTFLNAMTYPDKTVYPVASTNFADLQNLTDVYLDAVFHPRITEDIFRQEGWHYELEDPAGPLTYKGVVYNEMKGAYSSPDSVLYEYSQQSLFPDTTYGLDSGGDPERIPQLTYEQFKRFHEVHYHPSNSLIWVYGDFSDAEADAMLAQIGGFLADFTAIDPDTGVAEQAPFDGPRQIARTYASGDGEGDDAPTSMLTVNWLLPSVEDVDTTMALDVLETILIGMPASPLRKALMDSGLGSDLTGSGLETELKQLFFSTGLKGVKKGQTERVEALIFRSLKELVEQGIDKATVAAALNTFEFHLREMNTGRYPRGLAMMLTSLTTWLHGGDPLAMLNFEEPLGRLKQKVMDNDLFFEELIDQYLLDNRSRTTLTLDPDPELGARREAIERAQLAEALSGMDDEKRSHVIAETKRLHAQQEALDSPEALASIPRLTRDDVKREISTIDQKRDAFHGLTFLQHDQPTAGIAYLDMGLDLAPIPQEYLAWIPLFARAITSMGTASRSFVEMDQLIRIHTGGIGASPWFSTIRTEGDDQPTDQPTDMSHTAMRLFVRAKCVEDKLDRCYGLLTELFNEPNFDDAERFKQIVGEEKSRLEQALIPSGHMFVARRMNARHSYAGLAAELTSGIEQLLFLRRLHESFDTLWPQTRDTLNGLARMLLHRGGSVFGVTAEPGFMDRHAALTHNFLNALHETHNKPEAPVSKRFAPGEGLTIPARVNYVGCTAKLTDYPASGPRSSAADAVVVKHLRMAYLWDRVRVQGGAYGCFALYDPMAAALSCCSYRDPNVTRTLGVYKEMADYLHTLDLHADELDKAIIGAIGDVDSYMLPDAKGFTALTRTLTNVTDDYRQHRRDQILGTTIDDFHRFADAARTLTNEGQPVILGSKDAIEQAEEQGLQLRMLRIS